MIKVSVMYPTTDGANFDIEYYCNKHIPMVKTLLGDALKDVTVDFGIGGSGANNTAPFAAIAHLHFDSVESFQAAFAANGEKLGADLSNYTTIVPQMQISEIKA